jgi:hypothetical protein
MEGCLAWNLWNFAVAGKVPQVPATGDAPASPLAWQAATEFARLLSLSGQGVTDRRDGAVETDAAVGQDLSSPFADLGLEEGAAGIPRSGKDAHTG